MKQTEEFIKDYIKTLDKYHNDIILFNKDFNIDYIDDTPNGGLNVRISFGEFNYKENFIITYLELLTFIYKQNKL